VKRSNMCRNVCFEDCTCVVERTGKRTRTAFPCHESAVAFVGITIHVSGCVRSEAAATANDETICLLTVVENEGGAILCREYQNITSLLLVATRFISLF